MMKLSNMAMLADMQHEAWRSSVVVTVASGSKAWCELTFNMCIASFSLLTGSGMRSSALATCNIRYIFLTIQNMDTLASALVCFVCQHVSQAGLRFCQLLQKWLRGLTFRLRDQQYSAELYAMKELAISHLRCAVLCCAVLCCAVLCCAVPCRAVLCCLAPGLAEKVHDGVQGCTWCIKASQPRHTPHTHICSYALLVALKM